MNSNVPQGRARRRYAPKSAIDRAMEAVRANGVRVASVTVHPDGSIKLSALEDPEQRTETLFDALDREGRL